MFLYLLQFLFELVNHLLGLGLCEVLLPVLTQWNLKEGGREEEGERGEGRREREKEGV